MAYLCPNVTSRFLPLSEHGDVCEIGSGVIRPEIVPCTEIYPAIRK